ncbi:helix-turn-helix domain-containing protein [Nocardia otitidiscaviarum]|uniref:helix-turn-helix domain-containing protein n=1 Tax=Nocardia otitidiscaviarum TaxID=1823 RepID=UPI002455EE47|nr:helix-turn-helix domain-containing protein [Nocardia otitidiscaviarum]
MSCGCGTENAVGRGMCHTHYAAYRRRQIAYGRWNPRVPADAVREHIEVLRAAGVRPMQLARLAGVSQSALSQIMAAGADARVAAWLEKAVLSVPVPHRAAEVTTDTALVPIVGARRRFQALIASGYPAAQLARDLDTTRASRMVRSLMGHRLDNGQEAQHISAERERSIKALFDRLQLVPGPSDAARALGDRKGWPLPLEWDDDTIDDPNARPHRARWTERSAWEERRAQVADLTAQGLSEVQIARRLGIHPRQVGRDRAHNTRTQPEHTEHPSDSRREIADMAQVVTQARADVAQRRTRQRARAVVRTR